MIFDEVHIPIHFDLPVALTSDRKISEVTRVVLGITSTKDDFTTDFRSSISINGKMLILDIGISRYYS